MSINDLPDKLISMIYQRLIPYKPEFTHGRQAEYWNLAVTNKRFLKIGVDTYKFCNKTDPTDQRYYSLFCNVRVGSIRSACPAIRGQVLDFGPGKCICEHLKPVLTHKWLTPGALYFEGVDIRGAACLDVIDSSKFDGVHELRFDYCDMDAYALSAVLSRFKNVKILRLYNNYCHITIDYHYRPMLLFERSLDYLSIVLDSREFTDPRALQFKMDHVLMHPKLRLPAKKISFMRFGESMSESESYPYISPLDIEECEIDVDTFEHIYAIQYIKRFKDVIESVELEESRAGIWFKLAWRHGLENIRRILNDEHYGANCRFDWPEHFDTSWHQSAAMEFPEHPFIAHV